MQSLPTLQRETDPFFKGIEARSITFCPIKNKG